MKKSTTRIAPKKLALRRETIAALTASDLRKVAGGDPVELCSRFAPRSCNSTTLDLN